MKLYKYLVIVFALVLLQNCRSTKGLDGEAKLDRRMTVKKLVKENNSQEAVFNTLQARLKTDYTNNGNTQSYTITLRLEKDKVIWLSAPLGIARVMLTPEKAQFYDKINNQYYEGDYKLISDFLGTQMDYFKMQNILLGETIYDLDAAALSLSNDGTSYILQPETQNPFFEIFYLLNAGHFKLNSQQLAQPKKRRVLEINYDDYQEVENKILPLNMKIIAVEDTEEASIALEYKSVTLNEEVRFPFKIPRGFTEITIDDLPN